MSEGVRKRYGKWFVRYVDAHGVRREVSVQALSRDEAVKKRARLVSLADDQRRGISAGDRDATIASVFASYSKAKRRIASWETVDMWFRLHILPRLGKKKLAQLTKGAIEEFLGEMADKGLEPQSCEHVRMRLVVLFNWAASEGIYRGDNPAAQLGRVEVPEKPPVYLEARHVQLVLDCADEGWRNLFALAVYLGLRRGEFRALTTRDVDLVNRVIRVWRSGDRQTTKTGKYRLVPVPLAVMSYLEDQVQMANAINEGGYLFCDEKGKPLPPSVQPALPLRRAVAKAGLSKLYPTIRFHDLRKTFGTHFYEASGDITAAARMMGHSPEVAEGIYVGASARRMGALADRMDFKKLPPPAPRTAVDDTGTGVQTMDEDVHPSEEK